MDTILIVLITLTFFHFYMERFVIPILRSEIVEKLASLYGKIEQLRKKYKSESKAIEDFQNNIIATYTSISEHNFLEFIVTNYLKKEENKTAKINKRVNDQMRDLAGCDIPEIVEYHHTYFLYVRKLFIINSAGNLFYVLIVGIGSVLNNLSKYFKGKDYKFRLRIFKILFEKYESNVKSVSKNEQDEFRRELIIGKSTL